ncbi:MAG TPA: hypothetical protein GXZ52_01280 [Clostridiales bacterium]|jgi:hypothetical protein|nr:hypothetical protein [Clostridiales bacterium]
MDIHAVSADCVALLLDTEESADLNMETAASLVRSALILKGEKPWDGMEIDLFSSEDSCLIIATPRNLPQVSIADYALPFLRETGTDIL